MTSDSKQPHPEPVDGRLHRFLRDAPAHGSATDAVTDALREAILEGELAPGTWLREDEIAKALGVSRTPVREALRRLADANLTEHISHRGSVVASMTLDDILAVYLVRESLEGLAAQLTASRRPTGLVEALAHNQQQMAQAFADGNVIEAADLNLRFHRLLREGTGNSYLERFLANVEHAVRRFGRSTYEQEGRPEIALAEHGAILEAIIAGDPAEASAAAMRHMRNAREVRIRSMLAGTAQP